MNKTSLKTFVCSFVLTLFAVLSVNKVFFYVDKTPAEPLKIPHKNISLFFSKNSNVYASRVEPVHSVELQQARTENVLTAHNVPVIPGKYVISEIPDLLENDEIPLETGEKKENFPDENIVVASLPPEDVQPVELAAPESSVDDVKEPDAVISEPAAVEEEAENTSPRSMVIKATRQVVRIDNVKKRQERLAAAQSDVLPASDDNIPVLDTKAKVSGNIKVVELDKADENQLASLNKNMPLAEAEKEVEIIQKDKPKEPVWETMAEKHKDVNPWVVARGSKFPKNNQVLQEAFSKNNAEIVPADKTNGKKQAQVAVKDNILIPIPRDILDEEDLVPRLGENVPAPPRPVAPIAKEKKTETSFLDSLKSAFSSSKEKKDSAVKEIKDAAKKIFGSGEKEDKTTPSGKKDKKRPQILPTEIRLSFQPNRAEISGQTLRWMQAFANKAVEDQNVALEIRIDGSSSFALQQKRLNLLYNIFTTNGVEYQKINTVFVEREPNSFVIRTVKINRETDPEENDGWKKYYQRW